MHNDKRSLLCLSVGATLMPNNWLLAAPALSSDKWEAATLDAMEVTIVSVSCGSHHRQLHEKENPTGVNNAAYRSPDSQINQFWMLGE